MQVLPTSDLAHCLAQKESLNGAQTLVLQAKKLAIKVLAPSPRLVTVHESSRPLQATQQLPNSPEDLAFDEVDFIVSALHDLKPPVYI